jgi:hypothetical protein
MLIRLPNLRRYKGTQAAEIPTAVNSILAKVAQLRRAQRARMSSLQSKNPETCGNAATFFINHRCGLFTEYPQFVSIASAYANK